MQARSVLLGLVGAVLGWLEPTAGEEVVNLARHARDARAASPQIVGTPASGYRSQGAHFYTWQRERAEAVAWVEELSPFDRPGRSG